jgi:hypothetical protein
MLSFPTHDEKSPASSKVDMEKTLAAAPGESIEAASIHSSPATASATGDRVLVLMDLDNGLVGWEDDNDPENPQ